MQETIRARKISHESNKFEHLRLISPPKTTISFDSVKLLEHELNARGFLPSGSFYPIWFHAETERNIFLWRNGCSLIQADEFEFWVDLPKLILKRIQQITTTSKDNPLTNPNWADPQSSTDGRTTELHYLADFQILLPKFTDHMHALSMVTNILEEELTGKHEERPKVILPSLVQSKPSHVNE